MNFKTHVIGGVSAGVLANGLLVPHVTISGDTTTQIVLSSVFVAGAVLGSIFPDIDHRGSYLGRRARIISTPLTVAGEVSKQSKKMLNRVRKKKVSTESIISHRGITHTPLLLMILMSLMLFSSNHFLDGISSLVLSYMAIGFGIGIASHIFLDTLTKGGVPLLYPFSSKKFSFLPLKTGGMMESVIAVFMIAGTLFYLSSIYML